MRIRRVEHVFLLLAVLLCMGVCRPAEAKPLFGSPDSLEESGEDIAEELFESGVLSGKRIAVLEFVPLGKHSSSMLDKRIAEHVALALAAMENKDWDVVERLEVARMHNELQEHKDKSVDYNEWMRKSLRADLLVLGTYVLSEKMLHITARVVDPENGSTQASAVVEQAVDDETRQLSRTRKPVTDFAKIAEDITSILTGQEGTRKAQGTSRVKLFKLVGGNKINFSSSQPPIYDIGDKMGFSVNPPMDSRLYIFNYDPAAEHGEAILLYPIPGMELYKFPAERTRIFPACISQGVTSYDVEEPRGRMVFKVIGVEASLKIDLTRSLKSQDGYYWLDSSNLADFIEDLAALPDSSWWSEDIEFWIQ